MNILYILTAIAVIIGMSVAIWSYIDTRRNYFEDYMERKKNDQKHNIPR